MGLGRNMTSKMPFISHHIKVHAIDMTDHCRCLPRSPSVGDVCQVLQHRILFLLSLLPPPPHSISPSSSFTRLPLPSPPICRGHHAQPTLKGLGAKLHLLRADYLHLLFGIAPHGRFYFLTPFVYLFYHLFMSVWTDKYLHYTLGYNAILGSSFG